MTPTFFDGPQPFRRWLEKHHASESELLVGFWKRGSSRPSMTWPESVAEALCFGWIDAVRRSIDAECYSIRFTPRKAKSVWSAVNIRTAGELIAQARMQPAGQRAFDARVETQPGGYTFADRPEQLPGPMHKRLRADKAAWAWFQAQAPWYRRSAIHWVTSAKREATRERRLVQLIECCAAERTIGPLTRTKA
jgi:uncharacterized protein YdeI (YjbR/CyaY-like superfamily)